MREQAKREAADVGDLYVSVQIGLRLRMRRKMIGLTQEQLAVECGLTFQQIHKYESGQSRLSATRLVQIAAILEVSVSWFFDGVETQQTCDRPIPALHMDLDTIDLLSVYRQIPSPARRRQLLAFARLVASGRLAISLLA
jgi:transcriptional regulator with XRE-family HTH domain